MKRISTLILAALLPFLAPSCSTTPGGGPQDTVVILSAGVTYMTARAVQQHPEKAVRLREAADALDAIGNGEVTGDTVVTLVARYYIPGNVVFPDSELAKTVAAAIRAGLPAVVPVAALPPLPQ